VRALVVGNRGDADTGIVGSRLGELGFTFVQNEREYPREWKSLAGMDLLLLLGSEWSVYWDGNAREVAAEVDLVRSATARGVPVFAICFGAQLVAHAFGGTVSRSANPEIGWHQISSTSYPELLSREWLQWHYDVFTVPETFRTIASNDVGPQAMIGKRLFATQFHPEATLGIITQWTMGAGTAELHSIGVDPKHLCEISAVRVAETAAASTRLVDWFLAEVAA
jgi:GMP synthase-like glutamine amidotransferase